jgi:hypothetical protein
MRIHRATLLPVAFLVAQLAHGADQSTLEDVSESAPEPPARMEDGQELEPEVTIVQRKDAVVEEHRINGRLYQVRITPKFGKPYYLVDQDGDGRLETRIGNLRYQDPIIPQWVIFSW